MNEKKSPVNQTDVQITYERIKQTVDDLDSSLKTSQNLEQRIFQSEIQLKLDNRELSFYLDKQKYINSQLKKLAISPVHKSPKTDENLHKKCQEIETIGQKRDILFFKVVDKLQILTKENQILTNRLSRMENLNLVLKQDNKILAQIISKQPLESINYMEENARLTLKVKELNETISRLNHRNNIFKKKIKTKYTTSIK